MENDQLNAILLQVLILSHKMFLFLSSADLKNFISRLIALVMQRGRLCQSKQTIMQKSVETLMSHDRRRPTL